MLTSRVVRRHYGWVGERRLEMDTLFAVPTHELAVTRAIRSTRDDQTAILLVTEHWGPAIHTLLWDRRLFPGRFRSFVLPGVVKVQADTLGTPVAFLRKRELLQASLDQLEAFCWKAGLGTDPMIGHGTDAIAELERLIKDAAVRRATLP
ncbi:hypothetical protein [Paraburkholderia fungorum]|uniref:hypothetical protein n=1 Tax=Paraburkholderia fungorum TaxID=134537 RepID=UPI0038B6D7FC